MTIAEPMLRAKRHCIRVSGIGETYHPYVLAKEHDAIVSLLTELLRRANELLPDPEFVPEHAKEVQLRALKRDIAEVLP